MLKTSNQEFKIQRTPGECLGWNLK